MAHQGGYAPRSPDLSAYQAVPAAQPSPAAAQYQPHAFPAYQPPPYSLGPQQHQPLHQPMGQDHLAPPVQYAPPPIMPHFSSDVAADPDYVPDSATSGRGRGRKSKKLKVEDDHRVECDKPAPGVAEGIEVKTKFPVARIKRIMQADEDVGKVAQVTPIAVSKALELFMISLVTQSADQARAKSSKKVTAAHLKQVITQNSTFDFLSDLVAKVPDAPAPKREHKGDDSDETGEPKKRKSRAKRRVDEDDSS